MEESQKASTSSGKISTKRKTLDLNKSKKIPKHFQKNSSASLSLLLTVGNYNKRIKDLNKKNKLLASTLEKCRCDLSAQNDLLLHYANCDNQISYVKCKIKDLFGTFSECRVDVDELMSSAASLDKRLNKMNSDFRGLQEFLDVSHSPRINLIQSGNMLSNPDMKMKIERPNLSLVSEAENLEQRDSHERRVTRDSHDRRLTQDSHDRRLTQDSHDRRLTQDSLDKRLTRDSHDRVFTQDSHDLIFTHFETPKGRAETAISMPPEHGLNLGSTLASPSNDDMELTCPVPGIMDVFEPLPKEGELLTHHAKPCIKKSSQDTQSKALILLEDILSSYKQKLPLHAEHTNKKQEIPSQQHVLLKKAKESHVKNRLSLKNVTEQPSNFGVTRHKDAKQLLSVAPPSAHFLSKGTGFQEDNKQAHEKCKNITSQMDNKKCEAVTSQTNSKQDRNSCKNRASVTDNKREHKRSKDEASQKDNKQMPKKFKEDAFQTSNKQVHKKLEDRVSEVNNKQVLSSCAPKQSFSKKDDNINKFFLSKQKMTQRDITIQNVVVENTLKKQNSLGIPSQEVNKAIDLEEELILPSRKRVSFANIDSIYNFKTRASVDTCDRRQSRLQAAKCYPDQDLPESKKKDTDMEIDNEETKIYTPVELLTVPHEEDPLQKSTAALNFDEETEVYNLPLQILKPNKDVEFLTTPPHPVLPDKLCARVGLLNVANQDDQLQEKPTAFNFEEETEIYTLPLQIHVPVEKAKLCTPSPQVELAQKTKCSGNINMSRSKHFPIDSIEFSSFSINVDDSLKNEVHPQTIAKNHEKNIKHLSQPLRETQSQVVLASQEEKTSSSDVSLKESFKENMRPSEDLDDLLDFEGVCERNKQNRKNKTEPADNLLKKSNVKSVLKRRNFQSDKVSKLDGDIKENVHCIRPKRNSKPINYAEPKLGTKLRREK